MNAPLTGIIVPMVTPLLSRDELDLPGLERLVERIVDGGAHGLFILGTTGEGPSLSHRLRRDLVDRVCLQVDHRVPVLVGITDTAFVETVDLARCAAKSGADAVVAAPPYYLPEGQPELLEYLQHLVPELPLPLFIYNMPALTKVPFEPDTIRRAMEEPRIIGLKDSSGNMTYFHHVAELLRHRSDWTLLMGPEELLVDAVMAGGHGGVNGGANLFPRLYAKLYDAARAGDRKRCRELHRLVMLTSRKLYRIGRHSSALIKGLKCALNCLGVCSDFMAEPFRRFKPEQRQQVEAYLQEMNVELEKCCL